MLRLPGAWMWDFWLADDGDQYHAFFLFASRALQDERRRHHRAAIGHAVSDDLRTLGAGRRRARLVRPAGVRRPGDLDRQRRAGPRRPVVAAVHRRDPGRRPDLADHRRGHLGRPGGVAQGTDVAAGRRRRPLVRTAGRDWPEEAWRDPWVVPDPDGNGWHMLITARAKDGPADDRGVIGHAVSPDLLRWEVRPPLSKPGSGFGHIECPQVASVDDQLVLLFNSPRSPVLRRAAGHRGDRGHLLRAGRLANGTVRHRRGPPAHQRRPLLRAARSTTVPASRSCWPSTTTTPTASSSASCPTPYRSAGRTGSSE